MTVVSSDIRPNGAVTLRQLGSRLMEIILHIGAHRCASTTFQSYLRDNRTALSAQSISYWGPYRTRNGLLSGLFPSSGEPNTKKRQNRAEGRIKLRTAERRAAGVRQLLISDENMIGSARHCVRARKLYPAIGQRMAGVSRAFDGKTVRIVLMIRSLDLWWSSAVAYLVGRGHSVPQPEFYQQIAQNPRSWRDVITDLSCAVPEAEIIVMPFEQCMGQPGKMLSTAIQSKGPGDDASRWLNKTPDLQHLRRLLSERGSDADQLPNASGRWVPFNAEQLAQLQERYSDDLFWLTAGADGLATLSQDTRPQRSGKSLTTGDFTRGHEHDSRQDTQRHMARPG